MSTEASEMQMKAAIYARVSTRDKGQDPENQLRELRAYCDRAGWEIFREYIDHASGKSGDRDEFVRLFKDATERRFGVVLTWALDRFTREGIFETFGHVQRLTDYGVKFESFTEPHFRTTGPAGELMLAIAAWIAKQERERHRERTKAGMARAKAEGKEIGRRRRIFNREHAAELHRTGKSIREVAQQFGIGYGTARRAIVQFQVEPGPLERLNGENSS